MGKTNSPALDFHVLKFTDFLVWAVMLTLDILMLFHIRYFAL